MPAMITERHSITTDEAINIAFPTIGDGFTRLLLIYEASEEFHDIHIKDKIVDFLLSEGAVDITGFVNTSIYFLIQNCNRKRLQDLDESFRTFINQYQVQTHGKMFWLFNQITTYQQNELEIEQRLKRIAVIGRGNRTIKENFEADIEELKRKLGYS